MALSDLKCEVLKSAVTHVRPLRRSESRRTAGGHGGGPAHAGAAAEAIGACEAAGLTLVDCRYYNLHPLKFLHNHVVPSAHKNAFMDLWFDLEERLNALPEVRPALKPFCMALYLHVRRA
jgi:hypothetical protein